MTPEHLTVATAAHTARRGDLAEALHLLDGLHSPEALDLRARVLAQLGHWQEADNTWATLTPTADAGHAGATADADQAGAGHAGTPSPHLHPGMGTGVRASAAVPQAGPGAGMGIGASPATPADPTPHPQPETDTGARTSPAIPGDPSPHPRPGTRMGAGTSPAIPGDSSPHLHPGTGVEVGASAGGVLAQQALAGRALARKVLAGRARQRPVVRPIAAAALAVLAVGGIAVGTAAAVNRPDVVAAEPQPSVAPQTVTVTPTEQLDELNRRIAAEKAAAAQLDAIAASVAMPGVTVRREPGAVRVVFNRGLFSSGTTFANGSAELLTQLAPKLKRVPGITVVGQSVAVPGSEATGGSSTALARARIAAQHLAQAGGLPLTRLSLASGDQSQPLFPGQPRNRTVSLLLTP